MSGFGKQATGNWSAFGSGGRSAFGRAATNDVNSGGGGGGWAAFGGQRDERADQRKLEREQEAAREAAAARAKKVAEEAAAKKLADATNFKSEESYPALGGRPAPTSLQQRLDELGATPYHPVHAPKMNWGAAAQLGVQREAERAAAAGGGAGGRPAAREDTSFYTRVRPPTIAARSSSLTYDYESEPEEEDTYAPRERERQRMAYAGDDSEPEEEDGEFNADLHSGRRRGDKGVW